MIGRGEGIDKLVAVADGHANNNLVAFWRELPEDWKDIPGMDIHFAGSIGIPLAWTLSTYFNPLRTRQWSVIMI